MILAVTQNSRDEFLYNILRKKYDLVVYDDSLVKDCRMILLPTPSAHICRQSVLFHKPLITVPGVEAEKYVGTSAVFVTSYRPNLWGSAITNMGRRRVYERLVQALYERKI